MKTPELETERLMLRFIGSDDFIESSYRWQMTGALAPVIFFRMNRGINIQ